MPDHDPLDGIYHHHKLRCRLGWHNWRRWMEPRQTFTRADGSEYTRPAIRQDRKCLDCDIAEIRSVGYIVTARETELAGKPPYRGSGWGRDLRA